MNIIGQTRNNQWNAYAMFLINLGQSIVYESSKWLYSRFASDCTVNKNIWHREKEYIWNSSGTMALKLSDRWDYISEKVHVKSLVETIVFSMFIWHFWSLLWDSFNRFTRSSTILRKTFGWKYLFFII